MRFGLRRVLTPLVVSCTMAGCLVTNPALTDTGEETDDTSTSGGASSGQTTEPTATTSPTTSVTTGPTTTGPTTTDPDTTDTEDPDTTDTETTGPAACGAGHICINEAPAGWSGPVVWAETPTAEEVPSCPAAYPEPAFSAFDDLQAPPAECDCECGAATGVNCATITLEYHGTDSSCTGAPEDTFTINPSGACATAPNESSAQYWEVGDPGVTDGECTPSGTTEIPTATWNSASTVCGGPMPGDGTCDAGLRCLPEPPEGFESRVCVWQPGVLDCPAGDYSDRFIRHADFGDTRNCATCTCGDPTGDCMGDVLLWAGNDCTIGGAQGISGVIDIDGGCERGITTVQYSVNSADAGTLSVTNTSCEPSVGTAIGEAEPEDPYTLCCQAVQ